MSTKVSANDLRVGTMVQMGEDVLEVRSIEHVRTGKGGGFVATELKSIKTGSKFHHRFRAADDIDRAHVEDRPYQFLYQETGASADDVTFVFMHTGTFEQILVPGRLLEKNLWPFLTEGMHVVLGVCEEDVVRLNLPERAVFTIKETDPVLKHHTITSSYKPAILCNGVRITVPPYVEINVKVVVNPALGTYVERFKESSAS